ncbi:MAG: hypothetical protein AB7U73_17210 [Pirellulales bacterium]
MTTVLGLPDTEFVDRRSREMTAIRAPQERRQFADSHADLSPPAQELANAIDAYKLRHRRRFISYEEMLSVIQTLGYQK